MNVVITTTAVVALLGSAVISGVFFAFSSFIMKALARVPSSEGVAAMQSINVVVLNPSFLGTFMGTAALSALIIILTLMTWTGPSAAWFLAGAIAYLLGTFAVTVFGNVPLNEQLALVSGADPAGIAVWDHYLERWTQLNTIRTIAAAAAAVMFIIGLMLGANA